MSGGNGGNAYCPQQDRREGPGQDGRGANGGDGGLGGGGLVANDDLNRCSVSEDIPIDANPGLDGGSGLDGLGAAGAQTGLPGIGLDKRVRRDAMIPQVVGVVVEGQPPALVPCSTPATSVRVAVAVAQAAAKDSVVRGPVRWWVVWHLYRIQRTQPSERRCIYSDRQRDWSRPRWPRWTRWHWRRRRRGRLRWFGWSSERGAGHHGFCSFQGGERRGRSWRSRWWWRWWSGRCQLRHPRLRNQRICTTLCR